MQNFVSAGKKIVAVGRNYGAHAKELGNAIPTKPILFFKPVSAYVTEGDAIKIPPGCENLQHEIELGVIIGKQMSNVQEADAMEYVAGYALALDMTARDFQNEAKKAGEPWLLAKGFDTSCPVSRFIPKEKLPDPHNVHLWLSVNGARKQQGTTADMIFRVPFLLAYITRFVRLDEGDLVLTGTPEGVSRVQKGDVIECGIDGIVTMKFPVE